VLPIRGIVVFFFFFVVFFVFFVFFFVGTVFLIVVVSWDRGLIIWLALNE